MLTLLTKVACLQHVLLFLVCLFKSTWSWYTVAEMELELELDISLDRYNTFSIIWVLIQHSAEESWVFTYSVAALFVGKGKLLWVAYCLFILEMSFGNCLLLTSLHGCNVNVAIIHNQHENLLKSLLWLQFKPHQIAAGAAYLAANFLNMNLTSCNDVWHEFQTPPSVLKDVAHQLMELF